MYIPAFALKQSERNILKPKLTRKVNISLGENVIAYVVDENQFKSIVDFTEEYSNIDEAGAPTSIQTTRASVLRAVTTVFNVLVDAQKIKDPEIKTAAMAGVLSAITSIMVMSPEYGQRLISIIKSKI